MGLMIRKPPGEEGKALPAILIGTFVAFGGILFGYAFESNIVAVGLLEHNSYGNNFVLDMILEVSTVSWRWITSRKSLLQASIPRAFRL